MKKIVLIFLISVLSISTFSETRMKVKVKSKKSVKKNMYKKQENIKKGDFSFKNADRIFEDEWDLNFTNGSEDIFFRMPVREINTLAYKFIALKNGEPSSNQSLENNKFYIEYTEEEKEDENTGGNIIVRKIKKIEALKQIVQAPIYKTLISYSYADRVFEDQWDLNFIDGNINGKEDMFFRMSVEEIEKLPYIFLKEEEGEYSPNKNLKNKRFYIEYTEEEKEDENTGGMIIERKIKKISLNEGKYSAAGLEEDYIADEFIENLKKYIKSNDKKAIADLIDYPVKKMKSKKDFVNSYNKIFNQKFKNNILNKKDSFCNYNGIMLGNGEIWINLVDGNLKITVIN